MSELFSINSSINSYSVEIGKDQYIKKLNNLESNNTLIICDSFIFHNYKIKDTKLNYIKIDSDETTKDLNNISQIILQIKEFNINRNGLLIGIGGGVIQDITCFIASIYMRGIKWIYLPTTFLGMCDSCIGGKSSINVENNKNLVGNFYPAESIIIDSAFCNTLPARDIDSGLFEAIKILYAYNIKDELLERELNIFKLKNIKQNLQNIIEYTLKAKKWFIEIDELDKKERQLLNFGHCFGHAIESASNYVIPHGISVGLGMLWSLNLSEIKYPNLQKKDTISLRELIIEILERNKNFLENLVSLNSNEILRYFKNDKKHSFSEYAVIVTNSNKKLEKKMFHKDQNFENYFHDSFKVFIKEVKEIL